MDKQDIAVLLNVHPFCLERKTLSCSWHINWTVLWQRQKPGIEKAICWRLTCQTGLI